MTSQEPLICLEALCVRHWGTRVFDEVTLEVPRGAVYALLGRNGCGKSSLMRCLLGLDRPWRGRIRVLGHDPWQERTRVLARIGVVPEVPNAPNELTATQLVRLVRRLHASWDDTVVEQRLDRFEVPRDVRFGRLSKGQQGAVLLALALGHAPELLVLDDPTLGLDIIAKDELFTELIEDLADRGTTVFLSTHELALAEGLATHVGILANGTLVVSGELETVKQERATSLEALFLSSVRPARRLA